MKNTEKCLIHVEVRNGDINKALKIWKKKTFSSGHILKLRENQQYDKPSVGKRIDMEKAIRTQYINRLKEEGSYVPPKKNKEDN
jgi:small subunit ribosomal protein S21